MKLWNIKAEEHHWPRTINDVNDLALIKHAPLNPI